MRREADMVMPPSLGRFLFLLVEKFRHERRPDRDGVGRADEEMPLVAERRHETVFGLAACRDEGLMHAFGEGRAEEGIVFDIDPKHWHTRCAAEFAGRFHQSVRCAIVVWLAVDAAATAGGKGDDGLHLGWVQARKRD